MEYASEILSPQAVRAGVKFLVIGGYLVYASLGSLKLYRHTKTLPVSKIRSMAVGPVHLVGNLTSKYNGTALISGKKGPLVVLEIDQWKLRFRTWASILFEGHWHQLFLKDETGVVEVDPNQFQIQLSPLVSFKGWSRHKIPVQYLDIFKRIGYEPYLNLGIKIRKPFRIREYVVEEGEPIEIFGDATPHPKTGGLLVTNLKKDTFIFREKSHKNVPYKSLFYLSLGGILIGLGIAISVFYTVSLDTPGSIALFVGAGLGIILLYLKYYKII